MNGLTIDAVVAAVAAEYGLPAWAITTPGEDHTPAKEDARIMAAAIAVRHTHAGTTAVEKALNTYGGRLQRMLAMANAWKKTRPEFVDRARRVQDRLIMQRPDCPEILDAPPVVAADRDPATIPDPIADAVRSALRLGCTIDGLCKVIWQHQAAGLRASTDRAMRR